VFWVLWFFLFFQKNKKQKVKFNLKGSCCLIGGLTELYVVNEPEVSKPTAWSYEAAVAVIAAFMLFFAFAGFFTPMEAGESQLRFCWFLSRSLCSSCHGLCIAPDTF
jgi:hypothetical protein